MNTAGKPRIKAIVVDDRNITATLADGRIISVPLWWSWRLEDATPQQRMNYEIAAAKVCTGPTLMKTSAPRAC